MEMNIDQMALTYLSLLHWAWKKASTSSGCVLWIPKVVLKVEKIEVGSFGLS